MQLSVFLYLEPGDVAALESGRDNPAGALRSIAARSLAEIEDALIEDRLDALAWLAAAGLLEIKLAIRLEPQGGYARGLFYANNGIFVGDASRGAVWALGRAGNRKLAVDRYLRRRRREACRLAGLSLNSYVQG